MKKKPKGFKAFDALARKLVQGPQVRSRARGAQA